MTLHRTRLPGSCGVACERSIVYLVPMAPDKNKIDEIVRRIVETAHPLRIILFGSAERGEMGPHSDLDFLVVVPDGTPRRKLTDAILLSMWGVGFAKDIIVVTEGDVQQHRDNPYLIIKNALDEGKELYRAA